MNYGLRDVFKPHVCDYWTCLCILPREGKPLLLQASWKKLTVFCFSLQEAWKVTLHGNKWTREGHEDRLFFPHPPPPAHTQKRDPYVNVLLGLIIQQRKCSDWVGYLFPRKVPHSDFPCQDSLPSYRTLQSFLIILKGGIAIHSNFVGFCCYFEFTVLCNNKLSFLTILYPSISIPPWLDGWT